MPAYRTRSWLFGREVGKRQRRRREDMVHNLMVPARSKAAFIQERPPPVQRHG